MKGRAVRKLLLSVLTAVMIVLIRPVPVQADWIQDKFGWWFQEDDGSFPAPAWKEINGVWYYFKDTGYMAVGPMVIDDVQYYFHSSGAMASDEWIEFREDWYYFNKDGSLARNSWIGDLYYVDKLGAMVRDKRVNGIYIDEDGVAEHPGDGFFD